MKRLICILSVWCIVYGMGANAQKPARVPAYPGVIERVQPNGDTIYVRLHGDERRHWMTLADGQTLVKENRRGYICYAREKKNGKIVATCRKVKKKNGKQKSK
mgnify:FL=1